MKEVFKQFGIYGNDDIPLGDHFVYIEDIKDAVKEIKPHTHPKLFQFQVITSGDFRFFLKREIINVKAPAIVITPEHSVHGFQFDNLCTGFVLSVSTSLYDELLVDNPTFQQAFSQQKVIETESGNAKLEELIMAIEKVRTEQNGDEIANDLAIRNYFQVIFLQIYRLVTEQKEQVLLGQNKEFSHFRNFLTAIKKSFPKRKKLEDYASDLGVTVVHLNRICKKIGNKKAQEILQDYTVVRTNWYLSHTELTITEIAYTLNFNDSSYFCRFYKRNTGISPKEFRKKVVRGQ